MSAESQMYFQATDQNLDKALASFKESATQFGLHKAFSQANEQVKKVQSAALKEQEKMQAMDEIARNLTFNMVQTGASASAIEQAAGPIRSRPISSADDAILRGSLAGDSDLIQKGVMADRLSATNKLAAMEAMQNQNGKPLLSAETTTLQGFDSSIGDMEAMLAQLRQDDSTLGYTGPVSGRLPELVRGSDVNAFRSQVMQFFNNYKRSITGQAAGLKEMRDIEKSIPKLTDRPADFVAKAQRTIETMQRHKESYLKILQGAKKDVSGYMSPVEQDAAAQKALPKIEAWKSYLPKKKE